MSVPAEAAVVWPDPSKGAGADFTDSTQCVEDLLMACTPRIGTTGARLVAFKPLGSTERLALVFVGPEAELLARAFVMYGEALVDAVEQKSSAPSNP